ncbi:protein anon-37Cs [Drosophila tropicalis]|uniref:protein anon-37Cs n=1 Tax=Drosophila tropicalis TaxID=46794 RepID=UPI0035AB8674
MALRQLLLKPEHPILTIVSYRIAGKRSLYHIAKALKADSGNQYHNHPSIPRYNRDLETAKENARIVVIGAGLAGLSAAQHLLSHGFRRCLVLEATDRYGGRINSKKFGDTFCELGAKWVNIDGSHDSTYELLKNAEGLGKQIKEKEKVQYVHEEKQVNPVMVELIDTLFRQLCGGLKVKDTLKKGKDLHALDNVMAYFQMESNKIISISYKEPAEQQTAQEIFQSLFKEFSSIFGCCLEHVNIEQITSYPVVQQEQHPIYVPTGLDNVVNEIKKNLDDDQLQTGKPVGKIEWIGHPMLGEFKSVGCLDGSLYKADHIICTLPLGVLKNFAGILFNPTLPLDKLLAIRNLGNGNPVKIFISYKKPISRWFKSNLRPLSCSLTSDSANNQQERNWTQQVVEISQLPTSQHVLEIRIGGGYYDEIEKLPDSNLVEEITALLRKCIRNHLVPYPQGLLRSYWNSSACYLGGRPYFSISSSARDVQRLAAPLGEPIPSLLFAGDATTLHGFGTIDGARTSGIREAQRIIDYYTMKQCN